ncbi:MAG: hypothetical protein H6943_02990 [Zoogloeaceae bacterium]|nr:hypothetical protein [Zoogloeaceae bacterium]
MSKTKYWRWHFAAALLRAVLRGRLSFPGAHLPSSGHRVGPAFAGVGVAAAKDPAIDEFIIKRLRESGIGHVRLDYSPGDGQEAAARLLEKLCACGLKVTLHLVQPRDDARCMDNSDVRELWRRFVAETLDRFGSRIEMLELGSTANRQRWCGHSLSGFLAMWEIAWQEARNRKLTIVGPSVTDFEPPWNIGLLSILKKKGQLPDIHSDNLFSERCTEPERFDQKILGHALRKLHKFNLIKKARLLARLGADYGVPRLMSPAAFWTLPRIERMLPDSEQKQADYLARYMVLCAASGALERAWWGPLICHREGLIDNGKRAYPALERITRYTDVEGELADLRVRPALHALSAFAGLIPVSRYEGRLNQSEFLEIHAFRSDNKLIHALWTINGRAAPLIDLYQEEDLQAAEYRSRDGERLTEVPTLASEAPIYMSWPQDRRVAVKPGAATLRGLAIHRHVPGKTHYFFRENGWQGVLLASNAAEAVLLRQHIHPDRIESPSGDAILRHARNAIWTIADPRTEGAALVVKQPVKMHLHKKVLDRFKPAKALRSWSGTSELLRRGVAAAPPVAWFEKIGDPSLMQNYYICERVSAEFTAREMVSALASGELTFCGLSAPEAYRQLSVFLLAMHGGGILFRDLSGGNILISKTDAGCLSFTLIDTGRIRVYRGPLSLRQRFADLVRICNKLHPAGRQQFLSIYLAAIGERLRWWHRWPFALYDFKVQAKRRIGRKAWKKWLGA